jgi:SAM-dependent methyltransferase/methyltransferase-like protein
MPDPAATSYDELPYGHSAFAATHPDRLATVAVLAGLTPPPVECCRVLELGCGCGGNLLPMAVTLPDAHFVGVDLSPRQVASGRAIIDALGLRNIDLRPLSILDVTEEFGTFDYVLCHGVYSWVPAEVQEHILEVCRRNLAPDGVAYVSYNTYPGWHLRGLLRDMMAFHARRAPGPLEQVRRGRAFLEAMLGAFPNPDTVYGRLLHQEVAELRPQTETYVFHEHLEAFNQPLYFYQFVGRLAAHGLQYLGEADVNPAEAQLVPEIQEKLADFTADDVEMQQNLDFLIGRMFRRSLLCRAEVKLAPPPAGEVVTALEVTGNVRPVAEQPDLDSDAPEAFRTAEGVTVTTNHPLVKAALALLAEVWPRALPFAELWDRVRDRLRRRLAGPDDQEEGRRFLADALLRCNLTELVELHRHASVFAGKAGERPRGSPLARYQAAGGEPRVVNLRHRSVELPPFERVVLVALDGSRDRPALLEQLVEWSAAGVFQLEREGQPLREPAQVRAAVAEQLEPGLARLAAAALLLA